MNVINPLIFEERWLPITKRSVPKVKEGLYMVSDRGRVISYSDHRINPVEKRLVMTQNGYFRVNLRHDDGSALYYLIHRIVKIEFNPIEGYENLQVNHFDGNKANNCLWNLEWVTASQNINHAYKNGLKFAQKCQDASNASITNEQAIQIAELVISQKYSNIEIAEIVGCTPTVVSDIICGTTWNSLLGKYHLEKYKKEFVIRFTDEELHMLFKYFEDHKNVNYRYNADLFRAALMDLFGIEMTQGMAGTLSRLYNRQTRTNISSQYDF